MASAAWAQPSCQNNPVLKSCPMRACITVSVAALLLAACGGRSGPGQNRLFSDGGAKGVKLDRGKTPPLDGRIVHKEHGISVDAVQLRDRTIKDACLPIPAKQVQGSYKGTWKGTWFCPGLKGQPVYGGLTFKLSPAGSPDNFNMSGDMSGTVAPVMTFKASINGKMGCAALNAAMPDITVSSGAIIYSLTGTMNGLFSAKAGQPHGFRNGSWKASEPKLKCSASGSWEASYAGP